MKGRASNLRANERENYGTVEIYTSGGFPLSRIINFHVDTHKILCV